jgi:hypothetical protein
LEELQIETFLALFEEVRDQFLSKHKRKPLGDLIKSIESETNQCSSWITNIFYFLDGNKDPAYFHGWHSDVIRDLGVSMRALEMINDYFKLNVDF